MSIKDRLKEAMITSMKAKEAEKLGAIRFIQAAIKKIEVDTRKEMDDAAVIPILMNLAKQRRDSIEQFRKGGREDLAVKEESELKLIQSFLPEQMGADELALLVDAAIAETGAKSMRDMGAVMKAVGAKVAGRAEGSVISETVKKKLALLQP
ncbi:MAG: GatB/YqeY domain-containing protein [Bacteriovoracia bacterium]